MAEWEILKLQVDAPPEGAILPRYTYSATCRSVDDGTISTVSYITDADAPDTPHDACNTIQGLLGVGETIAGGCPE